MRIQRSICVLASLMLIIGCTNPAGGKLKINQKGYFEKHGLLTVLGGYKQFGQFYWEISCPFRIENSHFGEEYLWQLLRDYTFISNTSMWSRITASTLSK